MRETGNSQKGAAVCGRNAGDCTHIMAATYKRKKRKAGRIAIPFMITILLSLIAFGSVGYYFWGKLTTPNRELKTMVSASTRISEDDINEILFVLKPDDAEHRQPAVMLLRFDPVRKQEFCLGIPLTLELDHDGKTETVRECYETHGAPTLKNDIAKLLDQKIDRYIEMDSTGFLRVTSLIGNVSYIVSVRDDGIRPTTTSEELEGAQFETLLTSLNYHSETERNAVISYSVAALLNQCEGLRICANLDSYFTALVNAVTTDIKMLDFTNHRHAISYVFEHANGAAARGVTIGTVQKGDHLVLADDTLDSLKVMFSQKSADE